MLLTTYEWVRCLYDVIYSGVGTRSTESWNAHRGMDHLRKVPQHSRQGLRGEVTLRLSSVRVGWSFEGYWGGGKTVVILSSVA